MPDIKILQEITSITDGDTFRGTIRGGGLLQHYVTNAKFREYGWNAPENRGGTLLEKKLHKEATSYFKEIVSNAKKLQIYDMGELDSFSRFLVNLIIDGRYWKDIALEKNYGVLYDGSYSVKNFDWDSFIKKHHTHLL